MNKEVFRLIAGQLLLVFILSLILLFFKGINASASVFAGGLAYWLPMVVFVWRVFGRAKQTQTAKQFMVAFALGEAVKLILSGVIFVLIINYLPVIPLFVLIGFIGAVVAFWIASLALFAHDEEVGP